MRLVGVLLASFSFSCVPYKPTAPVPEPIQPEYADRGGQYPAPQPEPPGYPDQQRPHHVLPQGQVPATPVAVGQQLQAGIDPNDVRLPSGEFADVYTIDGQSGQAIAIEMSSPNVDAYLIVIAPNGETWENDDAWQTNSLLRTNLPETGQYQIFATTYRAGEVGPYELKIHSVTPTAPIAAPPPPSVGGPPVVANMQVARGDLAAGDATLHSGEFFDTHEFNWNAGTRIRIEVRSNQFDTYLIVRPPSGQQQDNDDQAPGNTNAALDYVVSQSGPHRVMVTSYRPGEIGGYELSVGAGGTTPGGPAIATPANPPVWPVAPVPPPSGNAVAVRDGQTIEGQLAQGDGQLNSGEFTDTHRMRLGAGRAARIMLQSTAFDPYLIVRTPSGRQLDNDDESPGVLNAAIEIPATEEGVYEIVVTSYRAGEVGAYRLSFGRGQEVPGPIAPTPPGAAPTNPGGGRVFGIFAGITDYPGSGNDLPECANDAVKLAESLRQHGLLAPANEIVLTDSQVTVSAIRQGFARIAQQITPNDTFIFFYSGHGGQQQNSHDARELDGVDETITLFDQSLVDDELGQLFDRIRPRVSILALDSCYSGGFAKDVITQPGRMGMFSSEEDVLSAVAGQFQAGGYLSHFLRTGIAGGADMDPQDSALTAGELTHYVYQQFATYARDIQLSGGYQHLVVDRGSIRPDFVLWRYR